MKKVILAAVSLFLATTTYGTDLLVPAQFPTIKAAINAAITGDTVIISPGTYTGIENCYFYISGKTITVRSIDPNNPTIVSSTIIDCNSVSRGFIFASNTILDGLTITNGGIGIFVLDSYSPVIHNCVITKNSDHGIYSVGSPTISGCTITSNRASYGSGIYINNGSINKCVITENTSSSNGGGIFASPAGNLTISDCTITGNMASNGNGGAIYIPGGFVTINNCVITENSSSSYGGGIYSSSKYNLTISDCNINENQASNGSGIYLDKCSAIISKCVISKNSSSSNGGGIYAFYSSSYPTSNLTISKCIITGNRASNGGGTYLNNGLVNIDNSFIAANASQINGAGVFISSASAIAQYCTFAGNKAAGTGGGVYMASYNFEGICDIFWGNTDSGGPASSTAQIKPYATSWTNLLYSCIQDADPNDANIPYGGSNNFNIDDAPLFVRGPNDGGDGWGVGDNDDYGDLHLSKNSPCIDAGFPIYKTTNLTDIDGQLRVVGQATDIGADEYAKVITVTKPKAGDVWATGSQRLIKWAPSSVTTVDIMLSDNNGDDWEAIAESVTDANNSYLWQIPDYIDSNQCVISILPADGDSNVCCRQSGLFAIRPYPRRPPVPFRWHRRLPPPDLSNNKGPRLGCVKWVFETAGSVFSQAAVTRLDHRGGYKIYAGCETGQIYALNNRGELLWSYDANAPIVGSPGIGYYDMIYVGAGSRLYAFDEDGELRWTFDTDGPIYSQPAVGYDGKIYVSSLDGSLYALGADGSELWKFETKGPGRMRGAIFTSPVIDKNNFGRRQRGGDIYIAGFYDPNLYALDAENGNVKWVCNFEFPIDACDPNKDTQSGLPFATCAVGRNGTIYQTLIYDPNLYAIDSADGTIIWRTNLADPCCSWFDGDFTQRFGNPSGWCEPAIGPEGTIYVSFDDPYLRAVKPDGTIKWVSRLGMVGGFTLSVGVDGLIYAASDDGFVCVVDSNGQEVSRFKGNGWVSFPVIAEDGTLIVSDANNILWAISSRGCRGRPPALHIAEDIQPSWNVDFMDLALLANSWLECTDPFNLAPNRSQICGPGIAKYGAYPSGDVDRDQYVDFRDFAAVAEKWLTETHRYYHGR